MKKIHVGALYEHYKKIKVKVIDVALHSETQEPYVVYIHLDDGRTWIRPLDMFNEMVNVDGKKVPRFRLIENE